MIINTGQRNVTPLITPTTNSSLKRDTALKSDWHFVWPAQLTPSGHSIHPLAACDKWLAPDSDTVIVTACYQPRPRSAHCSLDKPSVGSSLRPCSSSGSRLATLPRLGDWGWLRPGRPLLPPRGCSCHSCGQERRDSCSVRLTAVMRLTAVRQGCQGQAHSGLYLSLSSDHHPHQIISSLINDHLITHDSRSILTIPTLTAICFLTWLGSPQSPVKSHTAPQAQFSLWTAKCKKITERNFIFVILLIACSYLNQKLPRIPKCSLLSLLKYWPLLVIFQNIH